MTVYDAKGGNHGHGAVAAALSTGTTATGTFTVIPSPVPKLGLLGTTLSGASPRRFSHAGTEIVDSYARQASAFQPGNVAVSPVSPVATQRVRPQELGPHVDFLTQTSSCKETKNENAPMWGAWAPNTRSKPALIRHNSRMSTSEIHTHELGPDVKQSFLNSAKGNNIHQGRRLRPASASSGLPASFKTKQGTKFVGNFQVEPLHARRSFGQVGNYDNLNDSHVGAWSPSPTPVIRGYDDGLPELFVKSLLVQDNGTMYKRGYTPRKSPVHKANSQSASFPLLDEVDEHLMSPEDKQLLSMYRQMALSEEEASPISSPLRMRQRHLNVVNVDPGEALQEIDHDSPFSTIGTSISKGATPKGTEEKLDHVKLPQPMTIQSYTPRLTPAKAPQPTEFNLDNLEQMQEWRNKKSASRPPSSSRPLSASRQNRPLSAKGTPRRRALGVSDSQPRQLAKVDGATAGEGMRVDGCQVDRGRELQHMSEELEKSLIVDGFERSLTNELGIYTDPEDAEGPFDRHLDMHVGGRDIAPRMRDKIVPQSVYRIEQEAVLVPEGIVGGSSLLRADGEGSSAASRGSRPASGGRPSATDLTDLTNLTCTGTALLPLPPASRLPALIAAEQQEEHHEWQQQRQQQLQTPAQHVMARIRSGIALNIAEHAEFFDPASSLTGIKEPDAVFAGGEVHEGSRQPSREKEGQTSTEEEDRVKLAASVHAALMLARTENVQDVTNQDVPTDDSLKINQGPIRGFVMCPSCNTQVALGTNQKLQQPLVLNYHGGGTGSHEDRKVRLSCALTPRGQSPYNSSDGSRRASRPGSASLPPAPAPQVLQELAELKQQMLQVQGERQREREQHQKALEAAEIALKEALAANTTVKDATPVAAAPSAAVEESDKDKELKQLCEQLAAAEQTLAAAGQELAAAKVTRTPVVPPTSPGDAQSASGKPPTAPSSHPPSGVRRAPSTSKSTAAPTPTKKENTAKNTAPKVDAVEFQNLLDDLTSLKLQLESATAEAAAAKAQHEQDNKEKEEELEKLTQKMKHQVGAANSSQHAEIRKVQAELAKTKSELQVLRKQRDSKLAVHERQALKDGQDQLKVDQAQLAADQGELRLAHEAAQKDIADGARVESLRVSLSTKEEQLHELERDLRSQEVQIQSQWQGLRNRQEFLSDELEIACGDVKHDKGVLLKELRLTLTENSELSAKLVKLEAKFKSGGGKEAQTAAAGERERASERERERERERENSVSAEAETAASARGNITGSSSSVPGAALPRLPSLSLGDPVTKAPSGDAQEKGVAKEDSKDEEEQEVVDRGMGDANRKDLEGGAQD